MMNVVLVHIYVNKSVTIRWEAMFVVAMMDFNFKDQQTVQV